MLFCSKFLHRLANIVLQHQFLEKNILNIQSKNDLILKIPSSFAIECPFIRSLPLKLLVSRVAQEVFQYQIRQLSYFALQFLCSNT